MQALSQWVLGLGSYNLPVLAHTVQALAELRKREDSVTARDIAEVVLSDPLMSVKVLRFSQARLTSRQPTEVTTVEHAVMMHGVASFFRQFRDLTSLEASLEGNPDALRGALTVVSRAYHASVNARNFAALRHDMEGDEVMISALLHDLAEMLLWCVAPSAAMQIDQMLVCNKGLRSVSAQKATMGFPLADLQLALAREWRLPNLLQRLMDDRHAANARVVTVRMSVALARHAAHGWYDPALPDDYAGLQKLLSLPVDQVKRWVRQSALQAGRAWRQFAVRPAATWLPMLPGDWPVPEVRPATLPGGAQEALVARCREQLGAATKDNNEPLSVLALAFYGLQAGLGLRRLWFGVVNAISGKVEPRQTVLLDPGIVPEDLAFAVDSHHLFARLMQRSQGVWYSVGNREKLKPLVPEALRPKIGVQDFFAMSIHLKGAPHGLVYADGGTGTLDETRYTAFKQICAAASEALQRVGG